MKKLLILTSISISGVVPYLVLAQAAAPPPELQRLVTTLTRYAQGILVAISVLFIIYAAFLYLTSQGDPATIGKAKSVIIYAFVGIGVALLAEVLVRIVSQIFVGVA